jgi:uncharacterized membrane protein YdjX (TVP38/TMEM64 family)
MSQTPPLEQQSAASAPSPNRRGLILAGVVVALIAAILLLDVRSLLRAALDRIEQLGPWGAVLFVAIYVVATVLFAPGFVLTLGAGAVFGVARGSVLVSVASTLGATCAFLVGRYLARGWVAEKLGGNATFAAIDRAVAEEGWKIVSLTRLSPVFPFALLNYAFGLTRVKLRDYVLASWIGMMPGTVMYVYLGSLARAGADSQQRTPIEWALYGAGLAATVAVVMIVTRTARRELARRTQSTAADNG